MGTALNTRSEPAPVERQPGEFPRTSQGAPYVSSLTKTRKRKGKKDDLLKQCADAGIEVPPKATVADLHDLLGPEPAVEVFGRPSGFGSIIDDTFNLTKWKERQVALGVAMDPSVLERLQGIDAADERKVLDGIVARAHEVAESDLAARRGTAIHELTEYADAHPEEFQ